MDIKQVYREETNKDVYLETTGLGDYGESGSYKDEYVKWLENKVIRFEQQVLPKYTDAWQLCPKCNGQGRMNKPAHVQGDMVTAEIF